MAIKFQYNKTALQDLKRQLVIREKALPILKNKETALRQEVKVAQGAVNELKKDYEAALQNQEKFSLFWPEFPPIVKVEKVEIYQKNIVGIKVPEIEDIRFDVADISMFLYAAWIPSGIEMLKNLLKLQTRIKVAEKQFTILYQARKKTTQKVNLYEKVQIPELEEGIIKIKRFLEDKENISKAAQKIMKKRTEQREAAA